MKEWNDLKNLVSKGIGFHHAGMIPLLKEIVEILYGKGLIKILLATETFAMGVNFPTRTVVFCETIKMKRILKSEEYGQMAGRAGRRGLDDIGHVIILPSKNFMLEKNAINMILSKPQKIISKFAIDPIYVLKHLANDISLLNCNNSLFNYQNKDNNNDLILIKYKKEIDFFENEYNLNNDAIDLCNQILILINNYDFGVKLSNKTEKKFQLEKQKLLDKLIIKDIKLSLNTKDIDIIKKYIKLKTQSNELNKDKIQQQILLIINFLKELNYLDNNQKLSKIALIISEVNEINPYLLGGIYHHFENLDFPEIVALLSIFITDNKDIDEVYISDLNCSDICKNIIYDIQKIIEKFCILENKLNNELPYPSWMNWKIDLSMFNVVKIWASNNQTIVDTKFNGNFIKIILRINNLIKNVESIAKIFNDINIINKLYGYEEILIRDIITTESLYI